MTLAVQNDSAVKGQQCPGVVFVNQNIKDYGVILNSCQVTVLVFSFQKILVACIAFAKVKAS